MQTKNLKKLLASMLTFALVLALVTVGTGQKEDWRVYAADPGNAQYSLEGAEYYIYTDSDCTTRAKDVNNKNAVLTTGADGTTNEVELFEGTYYVKEVKASKGYILDTKKYKVVIEDKKVKWVNDGTVQEIPQSAPLSIQKVDKETGKPVAMGGASLADAQFQVVYTDGAKITKTWVIKTDADGIAKLDDAHKIAGPALYKNSKNEAVVPLGKVTITEIEPSTGYLKNNGTITILVSWEGPTATNETTSAITVSGATEGYALGSTKPIVIRCPEQVKRGDLEFNKITARTREKLSVPFVIKSKTTGESHVAYAGNDGAFRSASIYNKHTNKTNANDAIINPDGTPILDSNGWVDLSALDAEAGIWFYKDKLGNDSSVLSDEPGALPYDSYLLIELPCERNDGYELVMEEFEIREEKQEIKKEDIEDPELPPTYDMYKVRVEEAASDGKGKFGFEPGDFVTYDVKISNPNPLGSLTLDVSDKFIEGAENFSTPVVVGVKDAKQNSLSSDKNTVNITIQPKTVATVTYGALVLPKAKEYLADAAKDSDSEKDGVDCNKADRNNTPDEKDGYRNMAYTTNVTYKSNDGGRTDKLEPKEDDAQTPIKIPKIKTILTDGADHKVASGSEATLIDTISYEGLTPGRTYIFEDILMVKDTNKPLREKKKDVIARSTEIVPTDYSGTATVTFTLNLDELEGKELVAFATCYVVKDENGKKPKDKNGKDTDQNEVASHKDINDVDQTIEIPGYNMYKIRNEAADPIGRRFGFPRGRTVTYNVYIENISKTATLSMDVSDKFTQKPEYFSLPTVIKVENAVENSRSEDGNKVNISVKAGDTALVVYKTTISKEAQQYLAAAAMDSDSKDKNDKDCNKVDQANKTDDYDGYRNIAKTTKVTPYDPGKPDDPLPKLPPKEDEAQTPVITAPGRLTVTISTNPGEIVLTGDSTNLIYFAVAFILSGITLIALLRRQKALRNENKDV